MLIYIRGDCGLEVVREGGSERGREERKVCERT